MVSIRRQSKRGQAALEFLSTYGFAFLIILVMVGALTYFGVLNPQIFVPSRCSASEGFKCKEAVLRWNLNGSANVTVVIQNTRTDSYDFSAAAGNLSTVNASSVGYGYAAPGTCVNATGVVAIGPSQNVQFNCSMMAGTSGIGGAAFPARGTKIKVAMTLAYKQTGNQYFTPITLDLVQELS